MVQSKAARKIFPFLASFRSPPPRDSNVTRIEATPLSLATTIESYGEEIVVEDPSLPHRCTATTSLVTSAGFKDAKEGGNEEGVSVEGPETPLESSTPSSSKGVSIAKVTTIPQPSEIAIAAAAPRVSVESVQVIASGEGITGTGMSDFIAPSI